MKEKDRFTMSQSTIKPLAPRRKTTGSRRGASIPTRPPQEQRSRPADPPRRLHQFFERVSEHTPDAVAIDFVETGERLTYAELDARSARLARHLVGLGIGPNERVALHLPRGVEPYIAMLGVLRAGAAYVAIDVETPEERARFTVEDSGANLVLTTPDLAPRFAATGRPCLALADVGTENAELPLPQPAAEDLCYLIYTSGTTGKPKGVCISHQNAVAFVRGMLDVYGVRPDDRVLQGFSTAFDASVEEIWMAFATGATLVVGTQQTMRAVDELPAKLRQLGITVFSTVPTLLSVLDSDNQPQLKLLITGGEAARADVIAKWAAPGRRLLNGYGPTESAVVATYAWCTPGEPVTIGKPIPGYEAMVVDEALRPVADGVEGELCVGGPGVSVHGYLNRPDLNAQKFFAHEGLRFYRTGDLVCRDAQGDLLFRGRIDTQVKIRGYRVELEEIESHIIRALEQMPEADAFQGAIVAVHEEPAGSPQLVAYVVQRRPVSLDLAALVASLRRTLPPYMVPMHFATLEPAAVPRLPSGKVDRKRLPGLAACRPAESDRPRDEGRDPIERGILEVWREVLRFDALGREDSFFDFGGNSMLAAQAVSRFRQMPELAALTIRDLYEHPTAAALAARLRDRAEASPIAGSIVPTSAPPPPYQAPRRQYLAVATAQTVVLLTLLSSGGFIAYGMLLGLYHLYVALSAVTSYWWLWMAGGAVLLAPIGFMATLLSGVLLKRLLIGPTREGVHPVWGWGYFRWWLVKLLMGPIHGIAAGFVGTPLAAFFYRLLGARIGKRVYLGAALEDPDLVTIEEGASISSSASLGTQGVEGGRLHLRRVHIGKDAYVGAQSIVSGGARLGDGTKLHPLSCLTEGTVAPPGTEWRGSPAVQIEPGTTALSRLLRRHEEEARPEDTWCSTGDIVRFFLLETLYGYAMVLISLVPFALEIGLLLALGVRPNQAASFNLAVLLPASFLFAAVRFVGGLAVILAGKWLLTGRARPGTIPLNGREYIRRRFCGGLMGMLTDPRGCRPICETLLMPIFCRWLGMKIGRGAELSDAAGFQPDLVSLGEGAMLADGCLLGSPVVHCGRMTLGHVHIGDRSFLGNGAVMPITTPVLGDNSLVGVLSIPPDEPPPASDWLGSPPMRLPRREHWSGPAGRTFNPPKRLIAARACCNVFKIVLPGALLEILFWVIFKLGLTAHLTLGVAGTLALVPLLAVGGTLVTLAVPVVLKWVLLGRYPSGQRYLWSFWMWRMDVVYEVELLVTTFYGSLLAGTPWLPVFYRAQGTRIGRQACIFGNSVLESDLTTIGDHVTMQGMLQTHLFEDRVMKLGTVHIEDHASIGSGAVVLYDARVGAGASLGDLSLVMKNEALLPGRRYRGLPAENVPEPALQRAGGIKALAA
jgi:non-ribosomal peptide synthetase-like protein